MQKPNLNPPIKSICTTTNAATDTNPVFIVETYKNGTEWYRKYSDGVIEQGGYNTDIIFNSTIQASFITPYTTNTAKVFLTPVFSASPTQGQGGFTIHSVSTDSFVVHMDSYVGQTAGYYWEATGV